MNGITPLNLQQQQQIKSIVKTIKPLEKLHHMKWKRLAAWQTSCKKEECTTTLSTLYTIRKCKA
jgi:hypothetical protein